MYVVITIASLGLLYYTPQITGWLNAYFGNVPPVVVVLIPYIFGTIGLLIWGARRRAEPLEGDDQHQGAAAGCELFRHRHG